MDNTTLAIKALEENLLISNTNTQESLDSINQHLEKIAIRMDQLIRLQYGIACEGLSPDQAELLSEQLAHFAE